MTPAQNKFNLQVEVITPQWVMLYIRALCALARLLGIRPSYTHMQTVIRRFIRVRATPINRFNA